MRTKKKEPLTLLQLQNWDKCMEKKIPINIQERALIVILLHYFTFNGEISQNSHSAPFPPMIFPLFPLLLPFIPPIGHLKAN